MRRLMRTDLSIMIFVAMVAIGLALTTVVLTLGGNLVEKGGFQWILIVAVAFLSSAVIFIIMSVRLLYRNPISLTMSLVGFPLAGKTVYLTVLFDKLQSTQVEGIKFSPYGQETVEQVIRNVNILSKGKWLPPTHPGTVFYYRANASIDSGPFRRRYKIEIADFAGEKIGELDSSDEKWLHKTDYFKYVVQSEAVMFALDCQVLISGDKTKIVEMQNAFVAALQILAENKGVTEYRKLRTPIALLFLKSDLLTYRITERDALAIMDRFISICKQRCVNFNCFFVSSIGKLGPEGSPPETLNSKNLVEPIVWILQKI